jgi:hypothetical protein
MKYCPICQAEYRDDIVHCADCTCRLISEADMQRILAERSAEAQEVFIKIGTLENQFEADMVKSAFTREGIPVIIRSFHDTAYDGIFIPQKGWGVVLVPTEQKERATGLLEELKTSFQQDSEHTVE